MSDEVFGNKSSATVDFLLKMALSKKDPRLGFCASCGEEVDPLKFRDFISQKEWTISGLCQVCQDDYFGEGIDPNDE